MIVFIELFVILLQVLPKSVAPWLDKPILHAFSSSGVQSSGEDFTISATVSESPWTVRLVLTVVAIAYAMILLIGGRSR